MSTEPKSVVIMAGGTGGHVFPGLALAEALQAHHWKVSWLGTRRGIEARVVPAAGIAIHYLDIKGVRGRGLLELVKTPFRILRAIVQVRRWFAQQRPDLVVGLGGYAAGPGGIAAWTMGIPLVIHEQNARAGSTNKILSRFANKVLVAFDHALPNASCIGNPVRKTIVALTSQTKPLQPGPLHLLVLGGSLGAKAINELMPKALANMPAEERPAVIHQTGEGHLEAAKQHYRDAGVTADVVAFIEDMAEALQWADLVVCRAGALTVAELACAGVASVLIPFPHAIDDHQTANAQWLVVRGAAILHQQKDLNDKMLTRTIADLLGDKTRLSQMGQAAHALAKPHATEQFATLCLEVANGGA